MSNHQRRIQLDRTRLLGFKLDPSTPAGKTSGQSPVAPGAKFGAKLGGKTGAKIGAKPGVRMAGRL